MIWVKNVTSQIVNIWDSLLVMFPQILAVFTDYKYDFEAHVNANS